ncbi:hypothetical protein AGMMS50212_13910 [Spirochaetia bacterium]|nr:hypothetical protein AGMMS50212_13910 [Spirochaetia bacterium]
MKTKFFILSLTVFLGFTFLSCATRQAAAAAAPKADADFNIVKGITWQLDKITDAAGSVIFDKAKEDASKFGVCFTLTFGERASGLGVANNFIAPYEILAGQKLNIGVAAATMKMALTEPNALKEHEYYAFLEKINSWLQDGDTLLLKSAKADGSGVTLQFKHN